MNEKRERSPFRKSAQEGESFMVLSLEGACIVLLADHSPVYFVPTMDHRLSIVEHPINYLYFPRRIERTSIHRISAFDRSTTTVID